MLSSSCKKYLHFILARGTKIRNINPVRTDYLFVRSQNSLLQVYFYFLYKSDWVYSCSHICPLTPFSIEKLKGVEVTYFMTQKETNKQTKNPQALICLWTLFPPNTGMFILFILQLISMCFIWSDQQKLCLFGCLALLRLLCIFENECGRRMTSLIYQIIPIFSSKN